MKHCIIYFYFRYGHESPVIDLDIINNDRIISCGRDNTSRLFKIIDESQLIFRGLTKSFNMERITNLSNQFFVSGTQTGELDLWSINKKKPLLTTQATESSSFYITSLTAITLSDLCITGSWDGYLKFWKVDILNKKIECVQQFKQPGFINDLAVTKNGILFGGLGQEHRLGRWIRTTDVKNGVFVMKIPLE